MRVTILAALALTLTAGPALAQRLPDTIDRRVLLSGSCGADLDPGRVYGWVAFVDPVTGQTHVPAATRGGVARLTTIPAYSVRFRSRTNPTETFDVVHEEGRGLHAHGSSEIRALWYDVTLSAVRGAGAPSGQVTITYDPDQWCFDTVEFLRSNPEPFNLLERRSDPLPGLSDLP